MKILKDARFFAIALACVSIGHYGASATGSAPRKLNFPDESVGVLYFLPSWAPITKRGDVVNIAKGELSVVVPPDTRLLFEPNQRAFLDPKRLDTCNLSAIDAINVSFLSMQDEESNLGNELLKHLQHLNNLMILSVRSSDVSDAGLECLPRMPKLQALIANASHVHGTILHRSDFQNLSVVDISDCPLTPNAVPLFAKLQKLELLSVRNTSLGIDLVKALRKCPRLRTLNLSFNTRVDDAWISELREYAALTSLDLAGTKVSLPALLSLKQKKFTKIVVPKPRSKWSATELQALTGAFGSALVFPFDSPTLHDVNHDVLRMLRPTVRLKGDS